MSDRKYELEAGIQSCWAIVDDLDVLFENLCEGELSKDRIINIVLGLQELYKLKFEKTWRAFEAYTAYSRELPELCGHDDGSWCNEECERKKNAFLSALGCAGTGDPKKEETAQVPETSVPLKKTRKKTKN